MARAGGWPTNTGMFLNPDSLRQLECTICLDVLRDAVMHTACSKSMCATCIAGLPSCPHCRADCTDASWVPNLDLRNVVESQRVRCSNHGDGCPWQGVLSSLSAHIADECAKTLIDCPFRDKFGCDCARVRRDEATDYHFSRAETHMAIFAAREKELADTRAERDRLKKKLAERGARKRAREDSEGAPSAAVPSVAASSSSQPVAAIPQPMASSTELAFQQAFHAAAARNNVTVPSAAAPSAPSVAATSAASLSVAALPAHASASAPLSATLSGATSPLTRVQHACAAVQRLLPGDHDHHELQRVAVALQRLIDSLPAGDDKTDSAAVLRQQVIAPVIQFAETHAHTRQELRRGELGKRETRLGAGAREARLRRASLCQALLSKLMSSGGAHSAIDLV